jgi:hypothetical protein
MSESSSEPIRMLLIAVVLMGLAGCSSLRVNDYSSFDEWLVADPDGDYETWSAEYAPVARPIYGLGLSVPYGLRDGVRLALSPLVMAFYLTRGLDAVPQSFAAGPNRPAPPRELPTAGDRSRAYGPANE